MNTAPRATHIGSGQSVFAAWIAAAVFALLIGTVTGQTPVRVITPTQGGMIIEEVEVTEEESGFMPEGVPSPQAPAAAQPQEDKGPEDLNDQNRFKRLKKIRFDRRPSTWLAVWSKPEPLPVDEDPELAWPELPKAPVAPTAPDPLVEPKAPVEPTLQQVPQMPEVVPTDPNAPPPTEEEIAELLQLAARITAIKDRNSALMEAHQEAVSAHEQAKKEYAEKLPAHQQAMAEFTAKQQKFVTDNAAYTQAKAKHDAEVKQLQQKRLERELELIQRHVTLGRWEEVGDYVRTFDLPLANQLYNHILQTLVTPPWQGREKQVPMAMREHNAFTFDDIMALLAAAPPPAPKTPAGAAVAGMPPGLPPGIENLPPDVREQAIAQLRAQGAIPIAPPSPPPAGSGSASSTLRLVRPTGPGSAGPAVTLRPATPTTATGTFTTATGTLVRRTPTPDEAAAAEEPTAAAPGEGDADGATAKEDEPDERLATRQRIQMVTPLVQRALANGHEFDALITALKREHARPEAERVVDQRRAAWLLANLNRPLEMGDFLPSLAEAEEEGDREALNMLADHFQARYADDRRSQFLEQAWRATMAALDTGEIDEQEKARALTTAVKIAPMIQDQLGSAWLEESFTERPERGMEVMATIGTQASTGRWLNAKQPQQREEHLVLQKTAVDALLTHAPELAAKWRATLNLLADVWVREAIYSYENSDANSRGPRMERDAYGNIYWYNYNYRRNRQIDAVQPGTLLETRPDGKWLAMLPATLQPQFTITVAKLFLKVNEEANAFPYIEQLAATHPETANELAREFLQVWIKNHDPNAERNRTNLYMFSYGYQQRAEAIPLTRSKQERNLEDLSKWIKQLRALPKIELDEELLGRAFIGSHSAAEVYRLENIEKVFGDLETLEPGTVAMLVQTMRSNLARLWRLPATQKNAGTKRRQKDIQLEVLRGYEVAGEVLAKANAAHPTNWRLRSAAGSLLHDSLNYQQDIGSSAQYSEIRREAMALFGQAARLYIDQLDEIPEDDETTEAFDNWLYGALGASDLGAIDERTTLVRSEPEKIRNALLSIPGDAGDRHMGRFAGNLFSRLSSVNPAIKLRYLETGFDIVGDHPQAYEAKKVFDYYRDLTSEIQLDVKVDGRSEVGTEPFGLRLELVHTVEIERESGGFTRYLQNQQNGANFYNFGRPLENYRDKFEDAARAALEESFEVMSVTFNKSDVTSKAVERYGWRRTPYAYILLKARGEEVDRVPPLKLDMDFLDTSGYAVLPIVSPVVPVNASAAPAKNQVPAMAVTQTLDERNLDEGKLSLEIKAVATGLVPELEEILTMDFEEFEVVETKDPGVQVNAFGEDRDSIVSERTWILDLTVPEDQKKKVWTFQFPEVAYSLPAGEAVPNTLQRYDDVDMIAAQPVVELSTGVGGGGFRWWWVLAPLLVLGVGIGVFMLQQTPEPEQAIARWDLPEHINPFTVLGLLERIQQQAPMDDESKAALAQDIARVRQHYFGKTGDDTSAPDLAIVAEQWVRQAG